MTNQERSERCETCRFWAPDEEAPDDEPGYCQRHAPVAKLVSGSDAERVWARWPTVMNDWWCGEFHPARSNSDELPDPLPGTGLWSGKPVHFGPDGRLYLDDGPSE